MVVVVDQDGGEGGRWLKGSFLVPCNYWKCIEKKASDDPVNYQLDNNEVTEYNINTQKSIAF